VKRRDPSPRGSIAGLMTAMAKRWVVIPWLWVEPTLRRWHPHVATVAFLSYLSPRGLPRFFAEMTNQIPVARHRVPSLVYVTFAFPAV